MDKTSFWWTGLCAVCHPGGGPSEFDRKGHKYYDVVADQWGYEAEGLTQPNALDGDYTEVTGSGVGNPGTNVRNAPWDVTGVAEADCLHCHRATRALGPNNEPMNWIWRAATLRAKDGLQDTGGASVPAFAAASTAGQGWADVVLAAVPAGKPPLAATVDIDYQNGVDDGSLLEDGNGNLRINPTAITPDTLDLACWTCHATPDAKKRGRSWFDPAKDVHYGKFNGGITAPDQAVTESSTACTQCHPVTGNPLDRDREHNIAKGNATLGTVRNDTDWVGMEDCAGCHVNGPAPDPTNSIHTARHLAALSCEFCHIPYKLDPADLVVDNATTGSTITYGSTALYSNDPLNPAAPRPPDNEQWWPDFVEKPSKDGNTRLFPVKLLLSMWWGDWIDNAPAGPGPEDLIRPLPLWKVRHATQGTPPAGIVDDNGDGNAEVNTLAEIALYVNPTTGILHGDDGHGQPIAANPVLVKGGEVYFWDGGGSVVAFFNYEEEGVHTESSHPFSISHNVLPIGLYSDSPLGKSGCSDCHGANSKAFARQVLIDPFDTSAESGGGAGDGAKPVYKTVRELLGLPPDYPTFN